MLKYFKYCLIIFLLCTIMGCGEYIIGVGKLQKREIGERTEHNYASYVVEILDEGCNCTRIFVISDYENWYKPKLGSRVTIEQGIFGISVREAYKNE